MVKMKSKLKRLAKEIEAIRKGLKIIFGNNKDKKIDLRKEKRRLAELEVKLRTMKVLAKRIRDEDLSQEKEAELREYFLYLEKELIGLGLKFRRLCKNRSIQKYKDYTQSIYY